MTQITTIRQQIAIIQGNHAFELDLSSLNRTGRRMVCVRDLQFNAQSSALPCSQIDPKQKARG